MICPECLAPVSDVEPRCSACGATLGRETQTQAETFVDGRPLAADSVALLPGESDPASGAMLPLDARMRVLDATPDSVTVFLPAGNGGCMTVFGAVFLFVGVSLFWGGVSAFAARGGIGDFAGRGAIGLVFGCAGFAIGYFGLKLSRETMLVTASRTRLVVARRFLGRIREESIELGPESKAELEVAYEQNYQPVFCVRVDGVPKPIKFGTARTTAEKNWLVDAINARLGRTPPPPPEPDESMFRPLAELPVSAKETSPDEAMARLRDRGMAVENDGLERLLLFADAGSLPAGVRKSCAIGGLCLAVFALCVLIPLAFSAWRASPFMILFELLFSLPFVALLVAGGGLAAFATHGRGELLLTTASASTLLGLGRWSIRRGLPTADIDRVLVSQIVSKSGNPRTKAAPAKSTLVVCQLAAGAKKLVVPIAVDEEAAGWCYVLLQQRLREMGRPV